VDHSQQAFLTSQLDADWLVALTTVVSGSSFPLNNSEKQAIKILDSPGPPTQIIFRI
jgi:hypothetical protein